MLFDLSKKGVIPKGSFLIVEHLDRPIRRHVCEAVTLFFQIFHAGAALIALLPEREYNLDDKAHLSLCSPCPFLP